MASPTQDSDLELARLEEHDAGRSVRQGSYEAFVPSLVNRRWTWDDPRIHTLLEEATRALVELDAFSRIAPDVGLFTRLLVVKEANASSRIEGTRTEMDEAIQPDAGEVAPERQGDWQEVQNYIEAMRAAITDLSGLPLSTRLLKRAHHTLMQGTGGQHKRPGEYRATQNWIGGASIEDARFIPPPAHRVPDLMSDLEKFWHNSGANVPHLVRIAISHYQFETIHPFLDGNGRVGRLLITLYLISKGFLREPSLYLSIYFERHREAYFQSLSGVRSGGEGLGQWVRFFLMAVRTAAREGSETFEEILALRERAEREVLELGQRAGNARQLLALLYRQPSVSAGAAAEHLGVTHQTAMRLIRDFEELGLLKETTGRERGRRYRFEEYFRLFTE